LLGAAAAGAVVAVVEEAAGEELEAKEVGVKEIV
jgi:hypothetical protein